jgi:hypothetical protein
MYRVTKDFVDGQSGQTRRKGEILDLEPERVPELGDFVEPLKPQRETETAMIEEPGERAISIKKAKKVKDEY